MLRVRLYTEVRFEVMFQEEFDTVFYVYYLEIEPKESKLK
uniref:Translational initiation factor 1 n=1 Tax=Bouea macrophylla TaxID=171931 RepID=A0A976UBA7_9ROSI|nr:translational initiation factor 1 [Bouea macrophylla]YP_010703705.1 translational initiation factor 1 [Mangifera similis]UVF62775.1 translational initiation factor 1 [Bouea macrophylla]WCO86852.1 translational initiation factor 1 [Mangifera similis]